MENTDNDDVVNLQRELIRLEEVRFYFFFFHSFAQYLDLSQELIIKPKDPALLQQERDIFVSHIRFVLHDL